MPLRKIKIFRKKYLVKKSHNAEKPKTRHFRLNKRFLQNDNFKKVQDSFYLLLETLKNLWFSARLDPYVLLLKV